jgi:hypothetical protein
MSAVAVEGPPVTETNRERDKRVSHPHVTELRNEGAEATFKRFWKTVEVETRSGLFTGTK